MNSPASSDDERLSSALEAFCLAQEEGRNPQPSEVCGGDLQLELKLRSLLSLEPPALGAALSLDAEPMDAPTFEDFRLRMVLGEGGMGTVYRAYQPSLRRDVALKVLRGGWQAGSSGNSRMRREAELMASLDHPGIVPVHAIGSEGGVEYIAMRLLEGPSLSEVQKPVEAEQAAVWGEHVARALDAAHLAGVVHRDVKPSNVLLDRGQAVVVDFGLARSTTNQTLTRQGAVAGTLHYMPPEQLQRGASPLNPQGDVYGLGATLYELLAGNPPFQAETTEALIHQILTGEPISLRRMGVPTDLAAIVEQALEKDRERRYPSAAAFAADLRRFVNGEAVLARPTSRLYRWRRRIQRNPRAALGITLATGALLALSTSAYRAHRGRLAGVDHALQGATTALQQDSLGEASRFLDQARSVGSQDPRIRRLQGEWRARTAQRDLLDLLLLRNGLVDPAELDEVLREIEAAGPAPGSGALRSTLIALARYQQGDEEQAHAALQGRASGSRSAAATHGMLNGALDYDLLPPAKGQTELQERLLTVLALRLAGRPSLELRAELDLASLAAPGSPRVLLMQADLMAEEGNYARAHQALRGVKGSPRLERMRRWREIGARLEGGDREGAGKLLAEIPFEERNASEHHYGLVHVQFTEGYAAGMRYLDRLGEAGQAGPRAYLDKALMMGLLARVPDLEGALEILDQALELEPGQHDRQWIQATQLLLESMLVTNFYEFPEQSLDEQGVLGLRERGLHVLDQLPMAGPRARAHVAMANLHDTEMRFQEPRSMALLHLGQATERMPSQIDYRSRLMVLLAAEVERDDLEEPYQRACAEDVLGHMSEVLAQLQRGDLRPSVLDAYLLRSAALSSDFLELPRAILEHVPHYLGLVVQEPVYGGADPLIEHLLASLAQTIAEQPSARTDRAIQQLIDALPDLVELEMIRKPALATVAGALEDSQDPKHEVLLKLAKSLQEDLGQAGTTGR